MTSWWGATAPNKDRGATEGELSLAATLPHALTLTGAGRRSSSREVRLAADMLTAAVESLALRLDRTYLKTGAAVHEVLSSYAADHGFDPRA